MIAFIDSYIEPQDGTDIAPAWDRALASGSRVIVFTPGSTYQTSRALVIDRRVLVVGWLSILMCALGGFVVESGGSLSVIAGIEARGTNVTIPAAGFLFRARAWLLGCTAWKFGGDGFEIDGTASNANCGVMIGCFATGCRGTGYSWRGADGNAWTVLGCSASNCFGTIAGFWDRSFLGTFFFGCHSGNHSNPVPANGKPLGVALDSNSAGGAWVAGYQETSHQVRVMAPNTALGGIYELSPDSNCARVAGSKNGLGILGRVIVGRVDDNQPRIVFGPAVIGSVAELSMTGEYPYTLLFDAPSKRWIVRRANMPSQSVLELRSDAAGIAFPMGFGVGVGTLRRSVTVSANKPTAAGTIGDIVLAATPTDTLDGWRYVQSPAGPGWRAFVWPSGSA